MGFIRLGVPGVLAGCAVLLSASLCRGQETVIGVNFPGVTLQDTQLMGTGEAPPDSMGAAGTRYFAELVNGAFAIYDKTTGALAQPMMTDEQFWANAGIDPGANNLSDPRLIFDPTVNRWFAVMITTESRNNRILVARSDGLDPNGTWKAVSFVGNVGGRGRFADFPTLGLDASGIYVCADMFTSSIGNFNSVSVFSIPKADILASTPTLANMTRFDGNSAAVLGFAIQPVINFGPSIGHETLIAADNGNFSVIDRTNLTGTGGAGAKMAGTTYISVAATSEPPLARQPDGTRTIDTIDDRFGSAVYQVGNYLYMVHDSNIGGSAAIRWTKLYEPNNAVVQEGTIVASGADVFMPSIAANANGDVVIGYSRSGPDANDFLSSYAVVGSTSGGVLTFGNPVLLKAGTADYHLFNQTPERWGDYSTTMVDPNDPNIFWTVQEVPLDATHWATQITQIKLVQWGSPGGGSYNVAGDWTASTIPGGVDAIADFMGKLAAPGTVTVDSPVTVGTINLNSANGYTLAGPAAITMQTSTGHAQINVAQGTHVISAPLSIAAHTDILVSAGGLTLSGPVDNSAGKTLTKYGPASLAISGPMAWGAGATFDANQGTTDFSGTASGIGAGAKLVIQPGATVTASGSGDPFTSAADGNVHLTVQNSGSFDILAGIKKVGTITGIGATVAGSTTVDAGATLYADSIEQDSVTVSGILVLGNDPPAGGGASPIATVPLADADMPSPDAGAILSFHDRILRLLQQSQAADANSSPLSLPSTAVGATPDAPLPAQATPEPGTLVLLAAMSGLALQRRSRG